MSQEDAVTLIKQLNDDESLAKSVRTAQLDAVVAEAKKTGLEVSGDDLKAALNGAQKGSIDVNIPGWFSTTVNWD
ncbi:Nitrogen fixation protein of unknown function [Jatrophihabitans endophyticus]|uniref:Nif11 domain-containing protein n=1 Tax=Jatrophihabitans endophyticus TaxID=1206085 RepID=A0A1M5TYR6_9ACTN|nr:Nif11 family protein [Jatrophihabitans endophyticus]SHH55932.1 Nitrogen fixation protein of unknown function [Jatrophihabitans endophyticus]